MKACFVIMFLAVAATVVAQTNQPASAENGIYRTAEDFLNRRLTLPFSKNDGKNYKLRFTRSPMILIKSPDSSWTFNYDDIWGYRENGVDWRLSIGAAFRVMYAGRAFVYVRPASSEDSYKTDRSDTKGFYFSRSDTSRVRYLIQKNLKEVYSDDTAFVRRVNSLPSLASVSKWDKERQCYQFITWLKQ